MMIGFNFQFEFERHFRRDLFRQDLTVAISRVKARKKDSFCNDSLSLYTFRTDAGAPRVNESGKCQFE